MNQVKAVNLVLIDGEKVLKRILKCYELVKILESSGWSGTRKKSSHIIYRHPTKKLVLSFPYKSGGDVIRAGLLAKLQRLSAEKLK